ncbi:MAG: polymerase, sigma-24 subunit, subfamily [Blastococcus sp.]|jgi:RNA polymerase sigma factor (sigma-70 family)|nr:polymerase, sigma-24 subunit, subfamily [Blastococcus sp.]
MPALALAPTAAPVIPTPRSSGSRSVRVTDEPSGARMLADLAAGDDATWQSTVRRYERLLRSSARAVLRSDADVDEAVQRTWVLLLKNAARIQDPAALPGWLATTARREALAIVRAQQRTVPTDDVADHIAPEDTDMAGGLMRLELRTALLRAVDTLPETQRQVVSAMLRGEQSYDSLSQELGMPRGSLGPLRGRAIRSLRAQLVPAFA